MKSSSVHQVVDASYTTVFGYLADIENFPDWAAPFCLAWRVREERHFVTSPAGELAFELVSCRETGSVDVRFGPTHDRLVNFPLRVVALGPGRSLVVFTGWQLPGVSDEEFAGQVDGMRQELGLLKEAVENR